MRFGTTPLIDITLPVSSDLCPWPGDPPIEVLPDASMEAGDPCNTSRLTFGSHTGTHVDAPWHFLPDGTPLDQIALDRWCGPCFVAHVPAEVRRIMPDHLGDAGIPEGTRRLLLRTANSARWDRPRPWHFDASYAGVGMEAARWIVEHGIQLIGIDYLSIEPYDEPDHQVHRHLLGNDVLIIEGLDLRAVAPGHYELMCLPLRLARGDGAPARVALRPLP